MNTDEFVSASSARLYIEVANRMYLRKAMDFHRPINLMTESSIPAAERADAPPMREECVPYLDGSKPKCSAMRLIASRSLSYDSSSPVLDEMNGAPRLGRAKQAKSKHSG